MIPIKLPTDSLWHMTHGTRSLCTALFSSAELTLADMQISPSVLTRLQAAPVSTHGRQECMVSAMPVCFAITLNRSNGRPRASFSC